MKKLNLFTLSFILCTLSSCSDNAITGTGNSLDFISGKIEKWEYGNNRKMYAYERRCDSVCVEAYVDSCLVDCFGYFTMKCTVPQYNLFSDLKYADTCCENNLIISPSGTKFVYVQFRVYIDSNIFWGVYRASDDGLNIHSGQCFAYYFIPECPSMVIGKDSCNYYGMTRVENWNCSFNTGWNNLYRNYIFYRQDSIIISMSTVQPQTMKWYLANILP